MTTIVAHMAGKIWKLLVVKGDTVTAGQDVVILESMKMEMPITAEVAGTVKRILVQEGDFVSDADVLIELE